jgi:alkylhydroperoxidase family enzyme
VRHARHLEPDAAALMYITHLKEATPQANGQSELRHLLAFDPSKTKHLLLFTQEVMRGPGPVAPGERELIAAMTSQDNRCLF